MNSNLIVEMKLLGQQHIRNSEAAWAWSSPWMNYSSNMGASIKTMKNENDRTRKKKKERKISTLIRRYYYVSFYIRFLLLNFIFLMTDIVMVNKVFSLYPMKVSWCAVIQD
jgi:hypothetical protein